MKIGDNIAHTMTQSSDPEPMIFWLRRTQESLKA